MKRLIMGALLAAQVQMAAAPAMAPDLAQIGDQRTGTFGGLRIRLQLGGEARDRHLRAGLMVAPMVQDRFASGETRLRIGEGFEFGLRGREPLQFSIGGRSLRRLDGQSHAGGGVPTGAWIAGGLVLVTIAVVGAAALALEDAGDD